MPVGDLLSEGVRALLPAAAACAPVLGLGVIAPEDQSVRLTYGDALGITAYRTRAADLPEPFRSPAVSVRRLSAADLDANGQGLLESRLRHTSLAADLRQQYGVREAVAVPVPDIAGPTWLVLGLADDRTLTKEQLAAAEALALRVPGFLNPPSALDSELDFLRRLEAVEQLLPGLFRGLDVRAIFDQLSKVTREMIRHDFASLGVFDESLERLEIHVRTSAGSTSHPGGRTPFPRVQAESWLYRFVDDLQLNPLERTQEAARAGGRVSLRVAVRVDDRILGTLDFTSRTPAPYSAVDLVVARRIADYVALALSHQRLAEESRRTAALRERAASLEMLSGLLNTLNGVLDIREVFDRVSTIAQKVLPHDALSLTEIVEPGGRIRVHACEGLGDLNTPFEVPAPSSLLSEPYEFRIVDDMAERPEYAASPALAAGMRALLVTTIFVEGRQYGGLVFYSKCPGRYTNDDVLVAVRIADHVSLALSHQRLAEQGRHNAELRARTTNLELLDELLAALVDSGALADVFSRMSEIARKVLAHSAAVLMVRLPDGVHGRMYASAGFPVALPDIVEVPKALLENPDWEYELVDNLALRGASAEPGVRMGFKSMLRVPIRLDGRFAGALIFFSKELAGFRQADVLVARRIADRMAVTLARDRELAASQRADEATARASKLESRVRALTEELDVRTGFRRVVGESKQWRQVLTQTTQVASTETTVLLLGESGTGKEVVARFLHRASPRTTGPFVALNCAALPEQLLEAELFGYERGAYTGATQSKPGQLEQAAGGTLFLDEVGEMSLAAQTKFLRVLQEREFQRLGGTRVLRTDARIVAATNRDLPRAIAQEQFREDLYYRLNVFAIHLPPLRERRDDILPLSEAFLAEIGRGIGRPPAGIARDARQRLIDYDWPGNVRELRNILERASILCEGGLITAEYLALAPPGVALVTPQAELAPVAVPVSAVPAAPPASAGDLQTMERAMIEQALQTARFNKSKAAKALGLTRQQLYVRMRKYELD